VPIADPRETHGDEEGRLRRPDRRLGHRGPGCRGPGLCPHHHQRLRRCLPGRRCRAQRLRALLLRLLPPVKQRRTPGPVLGCRLLLPESISVYVRI
jgi:hypothetical protein